METTLGMLNELIEVEERSVTMQNFLAKLIEEQADSTRTIQSLERQRKTLEKGASEAKTEEIAKMNESLLSVCNHLITLHSKLRTFKGEGSARFEDPNNDVGKLKADLET